MECVALGHSRPGVRARRTPHDTHRSLIATLVFGVALPLAAHGALARPAGSTGSAKIEAAGIAAGSWRSVPGGTWVPAMPEVEAARSQIESYIRRQARLERVRLPPWERYAFQYQGRTLRGLDVLYVNAYCDAPTAPADGEMVIVFDGGPCHFQAVWDPTEKVFVSATFNGQAQQAGPASSLRIRKPCVPGR